MKRVKLCVAALLIGSFSYGQCTSGQVDNQLMQQQMYEEAMKEFNTLNWLIEDVIDAIRMDMHYGHLERQRGNYYINEIAAVQLRNKQLMAQLWKNRSETLGEIQLKLK
jgi:hypothetical protein|tara:strand:- start:254 stop:580 length:327 start_codon:yes stop_codon:yes gene_type:complete